MNNIPAAILQIWYMPCQFRDVGFLYFEGVGQMLIHTGNGIMRLQRLLGGDHAGACWVALVAALRCYDTKGTWEGA